ncbi:MAG: hypothetical protein ACO1QS_01310 [Verrucomicrobiota bacterium]
MYAIPDLLKLLLAKYGEWVRLEAGLPPTFCIRNVLYEVDGPALEQENLELILHELADTRQLREFREKLSLDFLYTHKRTLFLVRVMPHYDSFRLCFHVIEKLRGHPPPKLPAK